MSEAQLSSVRSGRRPGMIYIRRVQVYLQQQQRAAQKTREIKLFRSDIFFFFNEEQFFPLA